MTNYRIADEASAITQTDSLNAAIGKLEKAIEGKMPGGKNYAGASTDGGAATSAEKLTNTTAIGSTTKGVYFDANGLPKPMTYELNKTVPSNAEFTDTKYTADTNSGISVNADTKKISNTGVRSISESSNDGKIGFNLNGTDKEVQVKGFKDFVLKKLDTPATSYAAQYQLFSRKDNTGEYTAVADSATIDIPKDLVVESGDVKTCTVANVPVSGYKVGDKYIDLVIANTDNKHIYIPVNALVDDKAEGISYSNATSKLTAKNVQAAIDEVVTKIGALDQSKLDKTAVLNVWSEDEKSTEKTLSEKFIYDNLTTKHDFDELTNHVNTSLESVENEVKMLNGVAEGQYITDSAAKMVKVVPDGVNKGVVGMVGGKTWKYNQLIEHGNMDTSDAVTPYANQNTSVSIANGIATVTLLKEATSYNAGVITNIPNPIPVGHTVFICIDVYPSINTTMSFDFNKAHRSTSCPANTWTKAWDTFVVDSTMESVKQIITRPSTMTAGTTYKLKNWMFFDATAMFGSGKEPTLNEFATLMSEDYYPFTEGDLWNAPVKKVVLEGVNLLDVSEIQKGKRATANGLTDDTNFACSDFMKVNPSTKYYYNEAIVSPSQGTAIYYYDSAKNYVSYLAVTTASGNITTPSNAQYIRINMPIKFTNPWFSISSEYKPYNKTTLLLDKIVDKLPDYGASVNDNLYNYVDFEEMVYHHKVGSVDLGDLAWIYRSDASAFSATQPSNAKNGEGTKSNINGLCSSYTVKEVTSVSHLVDKDIAYGRVAFSAPGDIVIKDSNLSSSDVSGGKISKLVGKTLNYELAQEELIDISDLLLPFKCEPGGTVTFENEHNLDVPNSVIYEKEMK